MPVCVRRHALADPQAQTLYASYLEVKIPLGPSLRIGFHLRVGVPGPGFLHLPYFLLCLNVRQGKLCPDRRVQLVTLPTVRKRLGVIHLPLACVQVSSARAYHWGKRKAKDRAGKDTRGQKSPRPPSIPFGKDWEIE